MTSNAMPQLRDEAADQLAQRATDVVRQNDFRAERTAVVASRAWHLVYTGIKSERSAAEKLQRRSKLVTFIPMTLRPRQIPMRELSTKQRRNPEAHKRHEPAALFPNYLFVHVDPSADEWFGLFRDIGIYGLGDNDMPARVPDSMIEHFKGMAQGGIIPPKTILPRLFFSPGEVVRVIDGAFAGHNAKIDELEEVCIDQVDESVPVRCLLDLLGRKVRVSLDTDQLHKL